MLRMRLLARLLLMCWLFTLAGCTMWGPSKNPSWKMATSSEHLTKLFWQDIQKKNWSDIEAHVAPTATLVGPPGVLHREQFIAHLKQFEITDFHLGEISSQPAGADIVVTYVINLKGTMDGQPVPADPITMMSVWQEVGGKWLLIAHSFHPSSK